MKTNSHGSKTALVYDHGLFLPLACKLAESFGKVFYATPFEEAFPHFAKGCIGDGYENVIRCNDIWRVKDQVDLFVFPDIQHAGLQLELESQGKLVWGSRRADSYEMVREKFLKTLGEIGLGIPKFQRVLGLTALRSLLSEVEGERFVKISRWRGDMETWRHISLAQSEPRLDALAATFGPAKEQIPFLVFEPIEAVVEVGYDGFCIDGKFPSLAVHGIEVKDEAYCGTFQKYEDLPEVVREVNEAFAPVLARERYRNFFSSEIRVTKDDTAYFIDPCLRCPSPSIEAQLELYANLPEILMAGAQGEVIDPEPAYPFAVQAVITTKSKEGWNVLEIPYEIRQWVKIGTSCEIDECVCVPPDNTGDRELGWVVGVGDTMQEAIEHLKETAEQLSTCPVCVHVDALVDALKAVEKEEAAGMEFSEDKMPAPESVVAE